MNSKEFENFTNQDFNSFSNWLFSLNAYEFTLIATLIGFIIAPTLGINQQNSLGNFFELLGQVILTINAQNVTLRSEKSKHSTVKPYFETGSLEKEILLIKQELIKLRKDSMMSDDQ